MYAVIGRKQRNWMKLIIGCLATLCVGVAVRGPVLAVSMQGERKIPIYSVEREDRMVSLGFNCAWDDADVSKILNILDKEDVKVTFFVVGDWAEKYPEACRMLYDAGHEVQSHSNKHKDMTTLTREEIVADTEEAARRIGQITGVRPTLFRPPSGAYNNLLVETMDELGYLTVQWDCDTIDWKDPTPDEMINRVARKAQPGSILLLHVGAKNTPAALPYIIDELRSQDYTFCTVSELIYQENFTIDIQGRQKPMNIISE